MMIRFVSGALVVYATAVAIGKLLGVQFWSAGELFDHVARPYDVVIGGPFLALSDWFRRLGVSVPQWLRDVAVLWVVLGRLVRRSIDDMEAKANEVSKKFNPTSPSLSRGEKIRELLRRPGKHLSDWLRKPATREKIKFTVFPFYRIWVDLRGDRTTSTRHGPMDPEGGTRISEYDLSIYWSLSPLMITKYLLISAGLLAVLVAAGDCA